MVILIKGGLIMEVKREEYNIKLSYNELQSLVCVLYHVQTDILDDKRCSYRQFVLDLIDKLEEKGG